MFGARVILLLGLISLVLSQSQTCGNLIAKDGWRYDLSSLRALGPQRVSFRSINGTDYTLEFNICGSSSKSCGSCDNPGVCLLPDTCYGLFYFDYMDPLLYGVGVQLRYYNGDFGQARWKLTTYVTIFCNKMVQNISNVQVDGAEPFFSIRMQSQAGCPAHGGYPLSFPYQYSYKKYTYTSDPKQGITEPYNALDTIYNRKRVGSTVFNSDKDVMKLYNFGDYDKYHNLSCYSLDTDEKVGPFQLPMESVFKGPTTISVYDPTSGKFQEVQTDEWQYVVEGKCTANIWFLSGKAVPVQQKSCIGDTIVFYDFKLGQPDGSYFSVPDNCKPFQTCGQDWNACKYPYCCNSNYTCSPCDMLN